MSNTFEPTYPKFAKTYHHIKERLPSFLDDDGSNLEDILTVYYEYLNINISDNADMLFKDIDEVDEDFVEYFLFEFAQFARFFEMNVNDRRNLIKYSKQMYEKKGTIKSFELFFRLLFKEDPEIYITKPDVIYASNVNLSYINRIAFNIGNSNYTAISSTQNLVNIKVLGTKLDIIRTIKEENILYVFFQNDLLEEPKVSSIGQNPDLGVFTFESSKVKYPISSSTQSFDLTNISAYGFNIYDNIKLLPKNDNQNTRDATYQVYNTSRGPISEFILFNAGENYKTGDYIKFVEGTNEYILRLKAEPIFDQTSNELLYGSVLSDDGLTTHTAPYTPVNLSYFDYLKDSDGLLPRGRVIGLKTSGYRQETNEGFLEIYPETEEKNARFINKLQSEVADKILFQNTPRVETSYVNKFDDTIDTASGTGLKIVPILKDSGKITDLNALDYGVGLDISNTKVKSLCTMVIDDPSKVGGNPIVELWKWEPPNINGFAGGFVGTNYGGKIVNYSPSKSRITIESVENKKGYLNRTLKPIIKGSSIDNQRGIYKLVVIRGETGKVLNDDYVYASDIQILPINPGSFKYGAVSIIESLESNDRNVLSSLNSILKDREYYHEYAYIIKSGVSAFSWSKMFKDSVHPAGFKFVPQLDTSSDEILPGTITIARTLENEKLKEVYINEDNNFSFPNRVVDGVEDKSKIFQGNDNALSSSVYTYYKNYVPGFHIDEDKNLQYSDAFLLETRDETNGLYERVPNDFPIIGTRKVYEVDYNNFFLNTFTEDDAYERYNQTKEVKEVVLPSRTGPILNNQNRVVSTTSIDENYWHSGWSNHSKDLYDRRNGYETIKNGEVLITYTAQTSYNGNKLERDIIKFPNGNSPIRFKKITRSEDGTYKDELKYCNQLFPADQRQININKLQYEEVNLSPDRGPYIELDDDPLYDTTVSTVCPNSKIKLINGTLDFSTQLDLEDPIRLNLGNEYIILEDYRDRDTDGDGIADEKVYIDSFFDYEPKGLDDGRTSQTTDTFDTSKTILRPVIYKRYDGTHPNAKTDDWYEAKEDNNSAAFINIEYTLYTNDTDSGGLTLEYDKLLTPGSIAVASFVDMSDDRKRRYDGIKYSQGSSYKIRPRKFEVFLQKETDLENGVKGTLEYTKINPNSGQLVTYKGIEAFNNIWRL